MAMRASPAKFLFENDFAAGGDRKPSLALDEHMAKLREAEAAAFARGVAQGRAESEAEAARRSAGTKTRCADWAKRCGCTGS